MLLLDVPSVRRIRNFCELHSEAFELEILLKLLDVFHVVAGCNLETKSCRQLIKCKSF